MKRIEPLATFQDAFEVQYERLEVAIKNKTISKRGIKAYNTIVALVSRHV